MPQLTESQGERILPILASVREAIEKASEGDLIVLHQMRVTSRSGSNLMKEELQPNDELHELKWKRQRGICALCSKSLPERGAELDRLISTEGYTEENTRLVHHECHRKAREAKGFQ